MLMRSRSNATKVELSKPIRLKHWDSREVVTSVGVVPDEDSSRCEASQSNTGTLSSKATIYDDHVELAMVCHLVDILVTQALMNEQAARGQPWRELLYPVVVVLN
jgi:hypothetical protein